MFYVALHLVHNISTAFLLEMQNCQWEAEQWADGEDGKSTAAESSVSSETANCTRQALF